MKRLRNSRLRNCRHSWFCGRILKSYILERNRYFATHLKKDLYEV